ncbi:MAG: ABC transporter permease [Sphingobacteriaceae bacterium]|nr:MAG: ABC transporter permease [Sphingobacteriaceae bacterium]
MFKLWATIRKDVRVLLRDKVGIALMFVMPIIMVVVVTSIQNSTFQLVNKNRLPIVIANQDKGQSSKQLLTAIGKIGMFKVTELPKNSSPKAIADAMHAQDAMLGITIPANFSVKVKEKADNVSGRALTSFGLEGDTTKKTVGNVEPLTLYYNPILQESLRLSVKGALQSALQMVESRETLRTLYFALNETELPADMEKDMLDNRTVINEEPVSKDGTRQTPNATQHNVPAWTIFAMFFVIMSLGGSVVREKVSGSFIRLKTLPTNYAVGLLSKQLTYLGVTMLQALVIFGIGIWLFPFFGLPALNLPADLSALVITTIICGWCAVSYAICVGVFAQTQEQANGFGAVSIVILAAVGGLMVPSFAMQGTFRSAANLSPMHWCLEAYYSLFLQGGKLADVMNNLIPLFAITLVIQFITYLGLKRKNLI